ncbi:MAG: SnoaL-like domain-containing protein [Flavobacteriaceae bacterium]|nr:SnoaL-like domain-containing protein [Flavobacteriaceae bacterium]
MKHFLFSLFLLISTISLGQRYFSEVEAQALIDTFFEGFHKGDTTMMKSVMSKDMVMQTAFTDKKGNHRLSSGTSEALLKAIASRGEDQKWDERLGGYQVKIDGNLAHVWTPYEFYINDTFIHCGANAFTLTRMDDGWKIVHLIDSRRRETCKGKK